MEFDKTTPRQTVTIQGQVLAVPAPFEDGHTCTANESAVLNQTLAENVRNNCAKRIKAAIEAGKTDKEIQKEIDTYVTEYTFGVRTGGRSGDPVQTMALGIATDKVKEALKKRGVKIKDVGVEKIKELAQQALDDYPQITEQATQIVKMQSADVGDINVGDAAKAKAA